ncbi:MAG: class I SAM-dependent methyltransferase [Candidatus Aegiribacteria sp.]|nr:class I SAM-dependent methyltransferase [Candidatus Aegiribacteria sp.]
MSVDRNIEAEKGNRKHWDELADVHSRSYNLDPLFNGGHVLDDIQLGEVGDVKGKSLLHLQCHIGSDTLSWARLGAEVTGVDISPLSLRSAREISERTGLKGRFIESSLFDLPEHLNEKFDIVYTSEGVLCWLSDLKEWGRLINRYLKPGGFFYLFESHPFIHVFDDESEGLTVRYPYFHSKEPNRWPADYPDYSDGDYTVKNPSWEWTWSFSDILNSLIDAGLKLEFLHEHECISWKCIPSMIKDSDRWYRLPENYPALPVMYSLQARKS